MNASIRIPVALIIGGLLMASFFSVLAGLISEDVDVESVREATRIEFTRMRKDTDVASKRDEKVEREPPPVAPEVPKIQMSTASVDSNVAQLAPRLDARGAMSKMSLSAGSDRDTIPLVRVPPDYPMRALNRGIEGWVVVQFTITGTGSVKDAIVIDAKPKGMFDEAAIKAILRYRYNPKIEDGVPVERVGVRQKIVFALEK
ncbi:MAG: energy transducer TonB [Porticoccaceae bacterium]